MTKKAITTQEAPAAIGPYSQAVQLGGWVYCSGQIPIDPDTGELVGRGDLRQQTGQVMHNLVAVLAAAGAALEDVVKATVYLTDMNDFAAFNEVYGPYFEGTTPPARACVAVAALPKGASVEIDFIVKLDEK